LRYRWLFLELKEFNRLLTGYVWLGVAGVIAMESGAATPGPLYDALLHAIFLGFVVSMIFGHAPIIFPAILGKALPFRSTFYVHLAVVHTSIALRLTGDLVDVLARCRSWGGLLNAVALLLFTLTTMRAIASTRR
jgi:hypothetical protein